jgi:peptidoglycan/LPS O-acetylase OafA/YrhL
VTLFFAVPWAQIWYWYVFFDANLAGATHRDPVRAMIPLWSLAVEEQFYFVWP